MLIVGDAATQKYDSDFSIKTIEIICVDEEEIDYICVKFGLKACTYQDLYYKEYNKDGIVYKLYSQNIDKIIKKIFKDLVVRKFAVKYANPFINFVFDSVRVVRMHAKFDEWLQRIASYTILSSQYVMDLVRMDNKYDARIDRYHKMLTNFGECARNIGGRPHQYNGFKDINELEALSIVCTSSLNFSPYFRMTNKYQHKGINSNHYLEDVFDKFRYQEQLDAVMECLYIDVITEFILPTYKHKKDFPTHEEVERAFDKCCMYRASQVKEPWIGYFIINNYYELQGEYHESFYDCFLNTMDSREVTLKVVHGAS